MEARGRESYLSTFRVRAFDSTLVTRPVVNATRGKFSPETTTESPLRNPDDAKSRETLKNHKLVKN